jgi:hypothetical protein
VTNKERRRWVLKHVGGILGIFILLVAYLVGTSIATFGWWSVVTVPAVIYLGHISSKLGEEYKDNYEQVFNDNSE